MPEQVRHDGTRRHPGLVPGSSFFFLPAGAQKKKLDAGTSPA